MSDNIEILSQSSIDSIDNCIICFYPLDKEVALLSCGHKYHFDCLKSWITNEKQNNSSNLCCICNKNDIEIKTVYNCQEEIGETTLDGSIELKNKKDCDCDTSDVQIDEIVFCCNIL